MAKQLPPLSAKFVGMHFVDENYHKQHPQLLHKHDDCLELFYVMQGSGLYTVGGQKYALHPGNLVICNAGTPHGEPPFSAHTMQSYCCVLQGLNVTGLQPNRLIAEAVRPVLEFRGEGRDAVDHLLLSLYTISRQDSACRPVCEALANGLLNLVQIEIHKQNVPSHDRERTEEIIRCITDYLDEHYADPLSLQELGERFHMSHYYLSHIFKSEVGMSPMRYALNRKIGEAQNLLMNTELQIGEISEALGFSDNCHFSNMFKKYVGTTPTQYRQHFRSGKSIND